MLEMDEHRLDYSSQLRPEKGFEVVFAVGTTYSLDLAALLNVNLTLGLGEIADSAMEGNEVCLFTAIEKMRGKLAVFCEQGRIRMTDKASPLCILFEDMVTQVVVDPRKPSSSFHPKVWVVEYLNKATKERKWRLLVLSRNLTFDTSWDIAVRLDGSPTSTPQESSKPIGDFLMYLSRKAGAENKGLQSEIRKMANRIGKVKFQVDTQSFDEFEFMPFGPRLQSASASALFNTNLDNAIIMSPFLSNTGPLERLAKNRTAYGEREGTFALIARDYQLGALSPETASHYKLYVPEPALGDVELDDGVQAAAYADLHAKMYFTEAYNDRNLYIGSLNASANGMYHNVECLLRLHVKSYRLLFADMLKSLVGEESKHQAPFAEVTHQMVLGLPGDDETDGMLDSAVHKAAKLLQFDSVRVVRRGDAYALECALNLPTSDIGTGISLEMGPCLAPVQMARGIDAKAGTTRLTFFPLKLRQVSAFFVLIAKDGEGNSARCIVKCPQEAFDDSQASFDERTQALITRILDSDPDALGMYVDIAFGVRRAYGTGELLGEARRAGVDGSGQSLGSGLYERLLVASIDEPGVLDTAAMLIDLIPQKYEQERLDAMRAMIDSFKKAVG